jgi:hypothetical protein
METKDLETPGKAKLKLGTHPVAVFGAASASVCSHWLALRHILQRFRADERRRHIPGILDALVFATVSAVKWQAVFCWCVARGVANWR